MPRPLNDLGALAERPLSTCTLNDQLERTHASRVGGGCPRPPPAAWPVVALQLRIVARSPRRAQRGVTRRRLATGKPRRVSRRVKRVAASSGRSQEVRFGPPRRGGMLVDPPARRDRHNHTDHAAHGHGHGQHRRVHGSIAKDMDGRTRGVTPDMHSRGTRLEGRFLGMRGASLFGSPASRGTVARQSFAPPPRRGGRSSSTLSIGAGSLP